MPDAVQSTISSDSATTPELLKNFPAMIENAPDIICSNQIPVIVRKCNGSNNNSNNETATTTTISAETTLLTDSTRQLLVANSNNDFCIATTNINSNNDVNVSGIGNSGSTGGSTTTTTTTDNTADVMATTIAGHSDNLTAPATSAAVSSELHDYVTDLMEYPDHLICPICLELLFSPFCVKPCEHVFCEPCLRRLARPCPTNTACPLCREIIGACTPAAGVLAIS